MASGRVFLVSGVSGIEIHSLEHDPEWAGRLKESAKELGLDNLNVWMAPVEDGFYGSPGVELPDKFGLALIDGPPRRLGGRQNAKVAEADVYVFDDANDPGVASAIERISKERGLKVTRMNVGHPRCFAVLS